MAAKYVSYHTTATMTSRRRCYYLPLIAAAVAFVARTAATVSDVTTTTAAPSYTGRRGGLGRGDAPAVSTIDPTQTRARGGDDPLREAVGRSSSAPLSSSRKRGTGTGGGGGGQPPLHHASGIRNIEASTSPASAQALMTKNSGGGTSQIHAEGATADKVAAADDRGGRLDFGGNGSIGVMEDGRGDDVGVEEVTSASGRRPRRSRSRHRRMWFTSDCDFATGPSSYVSSSVGRDDDDAGLSPERPYLTIQYAVSRRMPCQTIYVMDGTYRNPDFGENRREDEGGGRRPVVDPTGVSDLRITRHDGHSRPMVEFDGGALGGFVGGNKLSPVTNVEISGLEIVGPSASISHEEATSHRSSGEGRYAGRGIAIWAGHHLYLHNLLIHDCPGAGILVRNADHVTVADSDVYSNTRWSPDAESGIVISDPISVDGDDGVKMTITNNDVFDNVNEIPYHDPEWAGDVSPRVAREAGIDCPSIPSCLPNATEADADACPWQCRYGSPSADFVIDGDGILIEDTDPSTYPNGRWEVSDNTCYRNGVNGISMTNVDRIVVEHNRLYDNGVLPRRSYDGEVEEEEVDENEDHHGRGAGGRPHESGLVVRGAGDEVTWYSNRVLARYDDDVAFLLVGRGFDGESTTRLLAGGDNRVCRGSVEVEPADAVTPAPDLNFCIPVELPEDEDEDSEVGEEARDTTTKTPPPPTDDHPPKFVEVRCGDRCHVNSWPYTMKEPPYPPLAAHDACEQHCYQARFGDAPGTGDGCRAFSLHSIYDLTNSGNVYCFLYKDVPSSPSSAEEGGVTPVKCATDPFNTEGCSYSTRGGRFFITPEARVRYNVLDYDPQE